MACAMRPKLALAARAPSAVRPAGIASSFVSQCPTASVFSRFSGLSITAPRQVSISRPLVIMNNAKKCMGATSEGSNRKTKTTSGYRTRKATPTGRRVLKARRKKGRKVLCPASVRKDGKNRI